MRKKKNGFRIFGGLLVAGASSASSRFTVGVVGDLHLDPRDLSDSLSAREHLKDLDFLVSLGDLGESKVCDSSTQLFSGTTQCFALAAAYLSSFGVPYDVIGGNHDLEGLDEFQTDEANLAAFLKAFGKRTPQFCHEIAPKTLLVGLGSTVFRRSQFTSHEVYVDEEQCLWFEALLKEHADGWKIFVFTHAPIIGSGLRVLEECHVVNGCCWLNHSRRPQRFIELVRKNPQIKCWLSGHFHLSHDYADSITTSSNCVFAQTGVMRGASTRDGRRQSRLVRGDENGFQICTVDHQKGGTVRLDATVTYAADKQVLTLSHQEDIAHTPQQCDDDVPKERRGVLNPRGEELGWFRLRDGAVLGAHNGMLLEYDASTLAPLGMVVSRDELRGKRVAIVDDHFGGDVVVLYDDHEACVVQPNEDGTYWRRIVRNKVLRTREKRRALAATAFLQTQQNGATLTVRSSYGPYTNTAGQAMGISTRPHPFTEEDILARRS